MVTCPSCGEFVGSLYDHPIGPDGEPSCQTKSRVQDSRVRNRDEMAHQAFGGPVEPQPWRELDGGEGIPPDPPEGNPG